MAQGISEIFGEGLDEKGASVAIYRALRTLFCSACGTPIGVGALFTRRAVPGFGPRILPRCVKCVPFELKETGAESGETGAGGGSQLLESLLTPDSDTPDETDERPRDLSEEAARRLGPALSRSRRKPQ